MRDFGCPTCGQHLAFENSICLSCGSAVGFSPPDMAFRVVGPAGAEGYQLCANLHLAQCNWLVPAFPAGQLCASCALTRTRPADIDHAGMAAFAEAERAKRRLIADLYELRLPVVGRRDDPHHGLAFDLLSSAEAQVVTCHDNGVITVDLAEGDDIHRERRRLDLDEPYRTLLGHFRHEIGHYYFHRLVAGAPGRLDRFRCLFGDPDQDYQAAVARHYSQGAPVDWQLNHVSAYATMHPAEDWAETFAHYLHIRSTLDTAAAYGLAPAAGSYRSALGPNGFDTIIEIWLPLAWSLNMVNRSMGKPDLYPFVLSVPVLEKMRLIHGVLQGWPTVGW
ncbi:MAG: hypothetical protein FGM52_01990 [Mycobacterium sp.]|nr:hypothetical protein [Mycobacterium sp.]